MNTSRMKTVLAAAAGLALACAAHAQSSRVQSPDTQGGGLWLGPLNLSPFLNATALYDSNVDFVRQGEEDDPTRAARDPETTGFSLQPGFDLSLPGNGWRLEGRAYFQLEDYNSEFAESREDWSELLAWYAESDGGLGVRLSEMVQHVTHDDTDWEDRWNDRTETRLAADVGGPVSDKTTLSLMGAFSDMAYDDEDLYDWSRLSGGLTFANKLTDKTDGLVVVNVSTLESEDQRGSAESLTGTFGFASRATDKTSYRATVGAEYYTGFEDDESEVGLSYNLGLSWRANERVSMTLSGTSTYEPAEDVGQNSMLVSTLGLGLAYRPLTRWELMLNGSYRREDYSNDIQVSDMYPSTPTTGGRHRTDNQYSGLARVTYGVNRYMSLFAGGVYTYTTSSIEEFDYTRWRVDGGVALRY